MKKSLYLSSALCLCLASCKPNSSSSSVSITTNEAPADPTEERSTAATRKTWPPATSEVAADLLKENYLVVLDDSGSMKGSRITQAKQALRKVASVLPAEHNLALMFLNNGTIVPFGTDNRAEFLRSVNQVRASGRTPLASATRRSYEMITTQASRQSGYGTYHLILVTDGQTTDESPLPLVKKMVRKTSIQVHVVGFHLKDHEMNAPKFVDYQTASNSEELVEAFEAVAAETNEFTDPKEFSH